MVRILLPPAQSQRRTSPRAFGVDRAIPLSEGCSAYVQVEGSAIARGTEEVGGRSSR
jgi:hypothetical protein